MITAQMIRDYVRRPGVTSETKFCAGFGCTRPTEQTLCLRCALYGSPGVSGIEEWEPPRVG